MCRHISVVRCSRACMLQVNRTSGSSSSVAALSLIFSTGMSRPSKVLPMLDSCVMFAWSVLEVKTLGTQGVRLLRARHDLHLAVTEALVEHVDAGADDLRA